MTVPTPKIFLSYRREDSIDVAGRIHDRLAAHFGANSVFMDVDSIPFGVDFRTYLGDWVGKCDLLLAVVGDRWLEVHDADGNPRLRDPADFITIEISAALQRAIPVIPLLVGKAAMPKLSQLPPTLSQLAYRNAAEVRSGRDFHTHMDRLIRGIEQLFQSQLASRELSERQAAVVSHDVQPTKAIYVVVEPPAVANPTNLGFDDNVIDGTPRGWFDSFLYVGGVSRKYDISVVPRESGAMGQCVRMRRSKAERKEFGSLMQRCPIHNQVGNRIRLTADLRTEGLESWAGLWLRIDGSSTHLFFENMHDRPIKGTTPWTRYAIETVVPAGSEWLNYGCLLASNGSLWADDFEVSVQNHRGEWQAL